MPELYGDESPGRFPSCCTCGAPCGLEGAAYVILKVGGVRCTDCCRRMHRNALARALRAKGKATKAAWDAIGDLWA